MKEEILIDEGAGMINAYVFDVLNPDVDLQEAIKEAAKQYTDCCDDIDVARINLRYFWNKVPNEICMSNGFVKKDIVLLGKTMENDKVLDVIEYDLEKFVSMHGSIKIISIFNTAMTFAEYYGSMQNIEIKAAVKQLFKINPNRLYKFFWDWSLEFSNSGEKNKKIFFDMKITELINKRQSCRQRWF